MNIVLPDRITSDKVLMTNVLLEGHPNWSTGSYAEGDKVINGPVIWEALRATSVEPTGDTYPGHHPEDWLWVGYTNQHRMFTDGRDSKTRNENRIDVTVVPSGLVTTIALLGLEGVEVRLSVTDGASTTYLEVVESLQEPAASNFFELFTVPAQLKETVVFDDLMPRPGAHYRLEIAASPGTTAACGRIVMGINRELGVTNFSSEVTSMSSRSLKRDEFGNLAITPRRTFRAVDYNVTVMTERVEFVQRQLEQIDGVPTIFIGNKSYGSTVTFGIYQDFRINISGPEVSKATIRTEDF
ncbi:MAG: hypothetical protein MI794_05940 [Pseudomonadales bacterium]|nr:hypothetical protein [Pseudomonadales bacterium]